MAIVGVYTGGGDGGSSLSAGVTLTPPSGMAVGDTIVLVTIENTGAGTVPAPTGYTLASGPDRASSGHSMYLFTKVAVTADLTATVTPTWTTGGHPLTTGFVERGTYDVNTVASQTSGSTITPTGAAASAGDDVVVVSSCRNAQTTPPTLTTPSGYTRSGSKATAFTSGANFATQTAVETAATAGTYGADLITLGNSPLSAAAYVVVLTPAPTTTWYADRGSGVWVPCNLVTP